MKRLSRINGAQHKRAGRTAKAERQQRALRRFGNIAMGLTYDRNSNRLIPRQMEMAARNASQLRGKGVRLPEDWYE